MVGPDDQQAPPRLDVGVVGVGRAGAVLGAALARAGHRVVAVHGTSESSLLRAEALLPGVPVTPVQDVFGAADVVLLTVPDDSLAGLASASAAESWVRPGQFVVHCSGRYGVSVLAPATEAGALPLALHPAMTLTGTSVDLHRLSGCPFAVTAPPELEAVAAALVVEMGGEPFMVAEERRGLYHAALAYSANHMITLVVDAMDLLGDAGVERPETLLRPLLEASLANALDRGDQALTGPVARGDAGTVATHLTELAADSDAMSAVYRAMARRTADRALESGMLDAVAAQDLLQVLAEAAGPNR